MAVAPLVIDRRPRTDDFKQAFPVKNLAFFGIVQHAFRQVEDIAPVTVGGGLHQFARLIVNRQPATGFFFRSTQKLLEIVGIKTV